MGLVALIFVVFLSLSVSMLFVLLKLLKIERCDFSVFCVGGWVVVSPSVAEDPNTDQPLPRASDARLPVGRLPIGLS